MMAKMIDIVPESGEDIGIVRLRSREYIYRRNGMISRRFGRFNVSGNISDFLEYVLSLVRNDRVIGRKETVLYPVVASTYSVLFKVGDGNLSYRIELYGDGFDVSVWLGEVVYYGVVVSEEKFDVGYRTKINDLVRFCPVGRVDTRWFLAGLANEYMKRFGSLFRVWADGDGVYVEVRGLMMVFGERVKKFMVDNFNDEGVDLGYILNAARNGEPTELGYIKFDRLSILQTKHRGFVVYFDDIGLWIYISDFFACVSFNEEPVYGVVFNFADVPEYRAIVEEIGRKIMLASL